jgi:hypothetical protein
MSVAQMTYTVHAHHYYDDRGIINGTAEEGVWHNLSDICYEKYVTKLNRIRNLQC